MFITIIKHIKSLQKRSKCIKHQLNGYYNSLFNANNLTTYRRKVAVHPIKFCLSPLLKSESLVPISSKFYQFLANGSNSLVPIL